MNPIIYIRKHVFGVSQSEMARIAGVGQATISRWENGEGAPTLDDLDNIRAEAIRRDVDWSDSLFFEAPEAAE